MRVSRCLRRKALDLNRLMRLKREGNSDIEIQVTKGAHPISGLRTYSCRQSVEQVLMGAAAQSADRRIDLGCARRSARRFRLVANRNVLCTGSSHSTWPYLSGCLVAVGCRNQCNVSQLSMPSKNIAVMPVCAD